MFRRGYAKVDLVMFVLFIVVVAAAGWWFLKPSSSPSASPSAPVVEDDRPDRAGPSLDYTGTWVVNGRAGVILINKDGTAVSDNGFGSTTTLKWQREGDHIILGDDREKVKAKLSDDCNSLIIDSGGADGSGIMIRQGSKSDLGSNTSKTAVSEESLPDWERISVERLRQVATAITMFVEDNNGKYPDLSTGKSMVRALLGYASNNERLFINPRSGKYYMTNNRLSGKLQKDVKDPSNVVVIYEDIMAPDGSRAVLSADGNVVRYTEDEFRNLSR